MIMKTDYQPIMKTDYQPKDEIVTQPPNMPSSVQTNTPIGKATKFDPAERSRTYTYPNGAGEPIQITLNDVKELVVRESGTHRLVTGDGHRHIMAPGWLHIEVDVDEWTV
jgi:hypothetical protein